MERDPYRAKIGRYKAIESVFAPKATDPRLRRFCEAWQHMADEIDADSRVHRDLRRGDLLLLSWAGNLYDLTEGDAAAVCDAYALHSIGEPYNPERPGKVTSTLESIRRRRARDLEIATGALS